MGTCEVDGCVRPVLAKGLCASHYQTRRQSAISAAARAVVRTCEQCGESFSGRDVRARFCSLSCKEKARYARRPKVPKPKQVGRTCRECGESIDDRHGSARFCSQKCLRRDFNREKRRKRNIALDRHCPVCNVAIDELDPNFRIYCSKECRDSLIPGYMRARLHGITPEEFDAMLVAQDNRCAICRTDKPGGKGAFHVDHDHDTDRIRGLLCHNCNVGLGNFKDNPESLTAALRYLTM